MLDHSCQVQRESLKVRKDDLYETPTVAVESLLRVERLPGCIWEPACGRGAIAKVLRQSGHAVISSDLVNYGEGLSGVDFLMERSAPAGCEAIVTNPPYKLAAEFVRHALDLSPLVIMLMRLAFYESGCRSDILDNGQLARVHCYRKRLPMMHRESWSGPKRASGMAFAWFVWDRFHKGPTLLYRISW